MQQKKNLIIIGASYQTNQIDDKRSIYLDGCKLTVSPKLNTLDSNLTWIPHINAINKKCSNNLGVWNKVKIFSPRNRYVSDVLYTYFALLKLWYFTLGECL